MGIQPVDNGEYRIALGTLTEAEMIDTPDSNLYPVRTFPYASPGRPWRFITSDIVKPYTQRFRNGLNQETRQGKLNFIGKFAILNDAQLYWLLNTKFGGQPTPHVTVVTRNRPLGATEAARWCTINCKVIVPDLTPEALGSRQRQWAVGAGNALTFQFYDGTYALDSGELFT